MCQTQQAQFMVSKQSREHAFWTASSKIVDSNYWIQPSFLLFAWQKSIALNSLASKTENKWGLH